MYQPASNAIDGNLATINHTKGDSNENWLQVKLPANTKIYRLVVLHRTTEASRLNGVNIYTLTAPYNGTINSNNSHWLGYLTADTNVQDGSYNPPLTSSYVFIKGSGSTFLHIIELEIYGSVEYKIGETYTDPGATATDNVDGNVQVTTSGSVDTSTPGTYTITYTAVDNAGNRATATRTVVVDATPPTLRIKGANLVTIQVGSTYTDAGAQANDNIDGNLTTYITTTGDVNTSQLGEYNITYSVQDGAGNEANATRVVRVVVDATPPTITINYNNIAPTHGVATQGTTASSNYQWYQPASNAIDGNLATINHTKGDSNENWLQVKLPANTKIYRLVVLNRTTEASRLNGANIYTLTAPYNGTINSNNSHWLGWLTADTNVQDGNYNPPLTSSYVFIKGSGSKILHIRELEIYGSVEYKIGETYTDPGATATDNVDGNVQVTTSGSVDTSTPGTYTITYTAVDNAGNRATATRTVVVDATPPTLRIKGANLVTIQVGSTYTDAGAQANDKAYRWQPYNLYNNHRRCKHKSTR